MVSPRVNTDRVSRSKGQAMKSVKVEGYVERNIVLVRIGSVSPDLRLIMALSERLQMKKIQEASGEYLSSLLCHK